MKRRFTARVWQEGDMFVSQCLEVDVASCGESEQEAVEMLQEALELYFEEDPGEVPVLRSIEAEVGDAPVSVVMS